MAEIFKNPVELAEGINAKQRTPNWKTRDAARQYFYNKYNFEQDNNYLRNSVINMHKDFEYQSFNIPTEEKAHYIDKWDKKKYCFFGDNELTFNCEKINRIKKIISTDGNVSYFLSEENKNAVCVVGKNGIAFLLGCRTY